jgi:hypothetical protein
MPTGILGWLVAAAGTFTLALGLWHIGVPRRFGFREAIEPWRSGAVGRVRLGPWHHDATRPDVMGVANVMNAATTYALLSIGVASLGSASWLGTPVGRLLAAWIFGWWALRAAMQLRIGRRGIDLVLVAGFAALAALFAVAAVA